MQGRAPPGATLPPGASFSQPGLGATQPIDFHPPPVPGVGPSLPSNQTVDRFQFQTLHGRLELRELLREDAERIRAQVDVSALQRHISNVAFSDVRVDDVRNMVDEDFVRVFKLAQLMIQYVVHGQEMLVRGNEEYQRLYAQAETKIRVLNEQFRLKVQEIAQLKAERAHRKKALSMYEFMLWSLSQNNSGNGGGGNAVNQLIANLRQCKYCSRLFTADKIREHCSRRHPGEAVHDGNPLGGAAMGTGLLGQSQQPNDQLLAALLNNLGGEGSAGGVSDAGTLERTIERKLSEVLDRRGMGNSELADYELVEPVGGMGSTNALAPRRKHMQQMMAEAQKVEEEVARWQQELQRQQAKLMEVERQVQETKDRVSKTQETLNLENMRERMLQGRGMAVAGNQMATQYHPAQASPNTFRPAAIMTHPAAATVPQFGLLPQPTLGPTGYGMVTQPTGVHVGGNTYQNQNAQEGNHWEHSDHELLEKKMALQIGLEQKVHSQDGFGIPRDTVFTDHDYQYREIELQEKAKNERQMLAVNEADYNRKAGEVERELRNKMRKDWKASEQVFGGTLEPGVLEKQQADELARNLLQLPPLTREGEALIMRLFDSANRSVQPRQALVASDMKNLQGLSSVVSDHDVHEIWHLMDMNHDDAVDFPEFKVFVMHSIAHKFRSLDVDGSGHITVEEVGPLAAEFGLSQHKCIEELDWDKDGVVYLDDFVIFSLKRVLSTMSDAQVDQLALRPKLNRLEAERVLQRLYDTHDVDGNGTLDIEEVLRVLTTVKLMNEKHSYRDQVELAMERYREIKSDPSGDVTFEEFRSWMVSMIEKNWEECDTRNAGTLTSTQAEQGKGALCKKFNVPKGLQFFKILGDEGFIDMTVPHPVLHKDDFVSWVIMHPMRDEMHKINRTTDPLYLNVPKFDPVTPSIPYVSVSQTMPGMHAPSVPAHANPGLATTMTPSSLNPGNTARQLLQLSFQNLVAHTGANFVSLQQLIDPGKIGGCDWNQTHLSNHIAVAARNGQWNQQLSSVEFDQFMMQLFTSAFGRLDADGSDFISRQEVEEVISLLPGGLQSHGLALQIFRDKTAQNAHGDTVISFEEFLQVTLRDIMKLGQDPEYMRAGVSTLAIIANLGITVKVQGILSRIYRKIMTRDSQASRSSFTRLSDLITRSWGLHPSNNVLAKFVDPMNAGQSVQETDFVNFVAGILGRAFQHLDSDQSGMIDVQEMEKLASAFGDRSKVVLQQMTRSSGRHSLKQSEFYEFVATKCLEDLGSPSLEQFSQGLAKVIMWGQPLGTMGTAPGGMPAGPFQMDKASTRIFQALAREHGGDTGATRGLSAGLFRDVFLEIRRCWAAQNLGPHDSVGSTITAHETEFLDEFRVVQFVSAVLQRTFDMLREPGQGGDVHLSRVSSLTGAHSRQYSQTLRLDQFSELVSDSVTASARPSSVLATLVRLTASTAMPGPYPQQQPPVQQFPGQQQQPEALQQALSQLFNQMDVNRNGVLEAHELGDLSEFMRVVWKDPTAAPVGFSAQQIRSHDFVQVMQNLLQRVFNALDVAKTGTLSQPELNEMERAFGYDGQDSLVRQMTANSGYRVTFSHFALFLVKSCFANLKWGNFRSALKKIIELASMNSQNWGSVDQQLDRLFDTIDKNRSGTIEMNELGDLATILNQQWKDDSWYSMFRQQGGSVPRHVFHQFVMGILSRAFDKLDSNMDGVVDAIELQRLSHSFADQSLVQQARSYDQVRRPDFYRFVLQEMLKDATTDRFTRGMAEIVRLGDPNPSWQPSSNLSAPANSSAVRDFNASDFSTAPGGNDTIGSVMTFSDSPSPHISPTKVEDFTDFDFD